MYHLIIADDEYIIRESLATLVDWQSLGFCVVQTAKNGREVIETLKLRGDIHVILSDIQMPNGSGLEVARYVHENQLSVHMVMLSGYREFEYARQAITYQVNDYLLKPINLEDITATFSQLKEKLDENEVEKKQLEHQEKKLLQYKSAAVEKFFELAHLGLFTGERDICFYLKQFELLEELSQLRVYESSLQILSDGNDSALSVDSIYNLASMLQGQYQFPHAPVILAESETAYTMIQLVPPDMGGNCVQLFLLGMEKALHDIYAARLLLQINVKDADLFGYVMGLNPNFANQSGHEEEYLVSMAHQCLMIIHMTPEIEETSVSLTEIFRQLTDMEPQAEKHRKMNRLFELMAELTVQRFPDFHEIVGKADQGDVYALFCMRMREFYRALQLCKNTSLSVVDTVKSLVQEHIWESISLQQVAEKTFLSPNYLSRLFKEETGETFSDYTIRAKMEKAAQLLRNPGYKVYEVGERLGYKRIQHFYKLFRRIYDCTPTEYRDKLREGGI